MFPQVIFQYGKTYSQNDIEKMFELLTAIKEWKVIQYKFSDNEWRDVIHDTIAFHHMPDWRIKPEVKYRPWTLDEIPLPSVLRRKNGNIKWLITAVSHDGIYTASEAPIFSSFKSLLDECKYTIDNGKTWHPCGVEV
jgi:hypothetical protein